MSSYVLLPILGVPTVRGNECVNQTLFQTRVPAQPARWPGRPPPCCDALPRLLLRQLGFLKQSQTSDTEWRINNWYGTSSPLTTPQGVTISKWARATPCIPTEDFSDLNFAICEIALQSDVTGESVLIREGKLSEVIHYRLQMIWYLYFMSDMDTRPRPPGLRGAGLTTVLMGVRFSNLEGEFRWEYRYCSTIN